MPQVQIWKFEQSNNFTEYKRQNGTFTGEKEEFSLENFNNDLRYLSFNPDAANDVGFTLLGVDADKNVISDDVDALPILNSALHGGSFVPKFWNINPPLKELPDVAAPISDVLAVDFGAYVNTILSNQSYLKAINQPLNGDFAKLKLSIL